MARYEVVSIPEGNTSVTEGQVVVLPSETETEITLPSGVVLQKLPDDTVPPQQ